MRKIFWSCAVAAMTLLGVLLSLGSASGRNPAPLRVRRAPTGVSAAGRSSRRSGHLVGAIVFSGRVPRSAAKNRYHRGWVEVGQQGHLIAKQWVKVNHQYHFTLAPGTYDVAGYTRWGACRATARISTGQTTHQDTYCVWH